MLIPKSHEESVHVPLMVDVWIHLGNFAVLIGEIVWEQHENFDLPLEKQFQVFVVIFCNYGVILLGHDLYYGKHV